MDAGKKTINDIFNGNRILEIPFFQRAYVWGEDQWERLLEDMKLISSTNKPYFLGSVILKQQPTPTGSSVGDVRTIIDGQQRLTTLNLFFKVLCLKKNQAHLFDRIFRLINTDEIALYHNHNDIDAFRKILNLTELTANSEKDNISQAYSYFKENIDPSEYDIQNILGRILFVGIDLDSNEDEQQIFDTINSLGVRLTTAELLKNYFFNRDDVNTYEKYWKSLFEKDEETKDFWDKEITTGRSKRTFIDLFFYSYLQIKIQESQLKVRAEDKLEYSKVDTLFQSYKAFIQDYDLDKKEILSEIKDYAILFKNNFNYGILEMEVPEEYGVERINSIIFGLDTSTLIPYVLFVLKNVKDETERNQIFEFLETYIMRRIVVHANTKNYNQLFTDRFIANQLLSAQQLYEYIEKSSEKINFLPNDDELEKGFHESILVNKQAAGVIYLLESKIRNRSKQGTKLLGLKKYSLEHLMPKKWENNWGYLEDQEQRDFRNRKLLTLGNLAIITQSLNASIRDADWETKKVGRGKKDGLYQFSGGIETLGQFLNKPDWDEEEIEKRAEFLFENAKDIWKMEEKMALKTS